MTTTIEASWKMILRGLHKMGGGPLPRAKFDFELETESAASRGITMCKVLGMVSCTGRNKSARWTETDRGRDWCEGRIIVARSTVRRIAETAEEAQRRIAYLMAGSAEAAESCARLTAKQRETLIFVAKGFTFKEIAHRLQICHGAVTDRMIGTIKTLGCTRAIETVVLATKAGLV